MKTQFRIKFNGQFQNVASGFKRVHLIKRNRVRGVSFRIQCYSNSRAREDVSSASYLMPNGLVNYYEVLGINGDADQGAIKLAYRAMAKECHPDYMGETGHKIQILLNEAYMILSNQESRKLYDLDLSEAMDDEDIGYTAEALSEWLPRSRPAQAKNEDPNERRAVFVDELLCIGCKNCTFCAKNTFIMEPVEGRARATVQWNDTEDDLQAAIEACPVDCIHWVDRDQLPALEYLVWKKLKKTIVPTLMNGAYVVNVFEDAKKFARDRRMRQQTMKRKYSPAEEGRKKNAVEEIIKVNMGWFTDFFGAAIPVGGSNSSQKYQKKQNSGFKRNTTIAKERSIVPILKK